MKALAKTPRVVRAPRRRACIERSTLDPEHDIVVGGDHGRPK